MDSRWLPIAALLVFATSCQSDQIVSSTDKVIQDADREDFGLAGAWKPLPDNGSKERIKIEGPDPDGAYKFELIAADGSFDGLGKGVLVKRTRAKSTVLLVQAPFEDPAGDERTFYVLLYVAVGENRLHVGHISEKSLQQRLRANDCAVSVEYGWLLAVYSSKSESLLDSLMEDPKGIVSSSKAYSRE